ncbi:MAG: flavodoxin family protein [Anaerolineaceae bacterium]
MKAIALAVSARKQGNCCDFAQFVLERIQAEGIETELVNFYDHQITPCQRCDYECIQRIDPHKGKDALCPIQDDVRMIWEKTWKSEILFIFVPNYGGMPPALWLAFSQRSQAFFRQAPIEKLKRSVVSAVILASPHQSSGAAWALSFMADEVKGLERKVAGFEVINPPQFKDEYTFTPLIEDVEIQRRLEFLTKQTLETARVLNDI